MSGKTVSELNITVIKVDIVRAGSGEVVNCPITEEKEMNILDISKSNPVVLSDVSVPSGDYEQLRLVIKNNATITVDDETFDIKIPSGEQSGVKLDGNFSIRGKFFRLDLDFIPEESVIYNKGQGYIMKPVIKISDTAELLGYYRGNLDFGSGIGISECVLELNQDNTFKAKMANYPDRIIFGKYEYSSWYKTLKLWDFETEIEIKNPIDGEIIEIKKILLKEYCEDIPDYISLSIKEWTPDKILSININKIENILYRIKSFSFSEEISYTTAKIFLNYSDNSKSGYDVTIKLDFKDYSSPPIIKNGRFINNKCLIELRIPNVYITQNNVNINLKAYLHNKESEGKNKFIVYHDEIILYPYYKDIIETSCNSWNIKDYNLEKNGNNIYNIDFLQRMNIKVEQDSNKSKIVCWEMFEKAKEYMILVFAKSDSKESLWKVIYYNITKNNKERIYAIDIDKIPFYRIEVYALDGSSEYNIKTKKGIIYMESKIVSNNGGKDE